MGVHRAEHGAEAAGSVVVDLAAGDVARKVKAKASPKSTASSSTSKPATRPRSSTTTSAPTASFKKKATASAPTTAPAPTPEALLAGLLDCDLIGFHTYDYARHFLSSCSRILGTPTTPNGVDWNGRFVTVGAFPIGIDPQNLALSLPDAAVAADRPLELLEHDPTRKTIASDV